MTKRNVMITIRTARIETPEELFDEGADLPPIPFSCSHAEMPEPEELLTEGKLTTTPTRVELIYEESALSGMEGSVTAIGFNRDNTGLVSMLRTGTVETALIFEQGKRHYSVFETPISNFELCTYTLRVENKLLTEGVLRLDYLIEFHGAQAEHCRMTIKVK